MTTVSCPKCHDQVTVPSSAPRSARVRCPLCQEEYDLADALAQLPPALIVVSAGVAEEPVLAAVGGMEASTDFQSGSAIDHGYSSHLEGGSDKGYSSHVLDAGPAPAEIVSAPTPAFRASPRLRRKEKSMVGEVVKIVLGGVVGIGLAIVILWWAAGVDLGLAPTIAKVSWMRWVLPQKILDKVDRNQENKEENPGDLGDQGGSQPGQVGKLGSDSRFDEALKSSEPPKASSAFTKPGKTKAAAKADIKDPLDVSDPFAPEASSAEVGELKIESPLSIEPKAKTKTKPASTTDEPTSDDPFKSPEKPTPTKPAEPAEEKPAEKPAEKPKEEQPAEEKPKEEKPKEEKPPEEKPADEKPKEEKPDEKPTEEKP